MTSAVSYKNKTELMRTLLVKLVTNNSDLFSENEITFFYILKTINQSVLKLEFRYIRMLLDKLYNF